jgi:hypothetical protein
MEGAMILLANRGLLPHYPVPEGEQKISPRRRGVKQGALLMLIGAVLVPLMGVFSAFAPGGRIELMFEFFAALSAILCFVGGPLRMLFAAIFEEGTPAPRYPSYAQPAIPLQPARVSALPPPAANATVGWRRGPQTAEFVQPPSVTDGTTRTLEKPKPEGD